MENLKSFFQTYPKQMLNLWQGLSLVKKIIASSALLLIIIYIAAFFLMRKGESYEYLFIDLSTDDTQAIISYLKKSGLHDYIVDDTGVKVPESEVMRYRLKLTEEGIPTHGQVGWEKFDDSDFTRTEFERKIYKLRAIQGELARTIMAIEGITSARVHIVTPDKRLFEKDQKEPTAAIYIKAKRGASLTSRQIRGITYLVSKSVEGLKPENISIIDYEGKLLTQEKSKDPVVKQTREMLEYRKSIESALEEKVRGIVGRVVGMDRIEAKIDVEVDYTKEEQTISDVDPDKTAVLSSNTVNQDIAGSGLNPTGIPGSKSNVPGEQEQLNLSSSSAKSTRGTELINYEVSKKTSHKILPIGKIMRITAAVIVDGKQAYPVDGSLPVFVPRTKKEMQQIKDLVKSAIGFVEKRDEVQVHNMLFHPNFIQTQALQEKKKEKREYISTLAIASTIALAIVLFFAFIVRPYFRWLAYDPQRKKAESIVEEYKPDLELGRIQNVQVKEDVPFEKLSPQEQVMYLAKHEPQRTTEAIRILLNPHNAVT